MVSLQQLFSHFYKKYLINLGKYIKSKTIAIIAETIVSNPN